MMIMIIDSCHSYKTRKEYPIHGEEKELSRRPLVNYFHWRYIKLRQRERERWVNSVNYLQLWKPSRKILMMNDQKERITYMISKLYSFTNTDHSVCIIYSFCKLSIVFLKETDPHTHTLCVLSLPLLISWPYPHLASLTRPAGPRQV